MMMSHIHKFILAFLFILQTAISSNGQGVDTPNSITQQFQEVFDSLRAADGFPGATAAYILANGREEQFSTGYGDLEKSSLMNPGDRMLSGSTGKSFVAALALKLALEEQLSLDKPVKKWLGEKSWFSRLPNGNHITLRMLLRHQSGLIDHIHQEKFIEKMQEGMKNEGIEYKLAPEQLVRFVLDTDPLFPAGEGYHYSDTNYILVGLIIEAVTRNRYYDELNRRFLQTLKLDRTTPANRNHLQGLVSGYINGESLFGLPPKVVQNHRLVYNPATEWTGGGLVTNSRDLAYWAKVLYQGRAMEGDYLDELLDSVPKDSTQKSRFGPEVSYGLGVTIRETPLGKAYGHRGWTPGYLSIFEYYPKYDIAIAVQVNEMGPYDLSSYAVQLASSIVAITKK